MKNISQSHPLTRLAQRGALLLTLAGMLHVPHYAEEADSSDSDEKTLHELGTLQAENAESNIIDVVMYTRYVKQMKDAIKNYPDDKEIFQDRLKSLEESKKIWDKLQSELLQWAALRNGAGELDPTRTLTGGELKENLQDFATVLRQLRALELCTYCEDTLSPDQLDFLDGYNEEATADVLKKYAKPTWNADEIDLSDYDTIEHYTEQLRLLYSLHIKMISDSSHPEKKKLIALIKAAEESFFAYAETSYEIGMQQPFRASKYIAANNKAQCIIWQLRLMDNYLPL